METTHSVLTIILALIFAVSGIAKASGNAKALIVTREIGVRDALARVVGVIEALSAFGLVIGTKVVFIEWLSLSTLWFTMMGAIYFHFRANKPKTAFPAFFLWTLTSFALITI